MLFSNTELYRRATVHFLKIDSWLRVCEQERGQGHYGLHYLALTY